MNEHRDFLFVAWLTALRRTVRIGLNTRVAIDISETRRRLLRGVVQ
jgi:hypothetical protein